jgi:hypothetical protein
MLGIGSGFARVSIVGVILLSLMGFSLPAALAATGSGQAGAGAAAPTAAPPGAYTIYKELPCKCYNGQTAIAYRVGYYVPPDTGFGHKKVLLKHNMYTPVVAFIVKGPHNSHTNGTGGEAYAYAYHFVDGVLKQQIKIWAKYDTRKLRDNHSFGIVTAFCNGSTVCPQWVNQAINAQALPTSAASSAQPDGTRLGYSSRTS